LAVDLNLPGFAFFQVNWYVRNEVTFGTDLGQQVTLVWGAPFSLGPVDFLFEGFLDYAYGNDPSEDNLLTAPRLLLDVGKFFGAPGTLQAGVEYQIWRNKFGIDGIDEDVAQLMVKWIW
jgi:nucleoside-specific outer membrane channel protein Tsx